MRVALCLKLNVNKRGRMIGKRQIILGREALKALDRTLGRAAQKNMVDCRFKGAVGKELIIAPGKAVVVTDRLVGVIGRDIVCVLCALRKGVLHGWGIEFGVKVAHSKGGAIVFLRKFYGAFERRG